VSWRRGALAALLDGRGRAEKKNWTAGFEATQIADISWPAWEE